MRRLPRFSVALICCATVFLVFSPAPAQQSAQEPTLKSDVNLVSVYFIVHDSHKRLLDDLDQQQFQVREDGRLQTIKFFSHHSDVPLNVGVLLDTGTSTPSTLAFEADATSMFVQRVVRPSDLAFLVSYANRFEDITGANVRHSAAERPGADDSLDWAGGGFAARRTQPVS
jgi:hypothetical protein